MTTAVTDPATLLVRWYRELQEARSAEDPEGIVAALDRERHLRMLEHHVLYAMSRLLPSSPVDITLIEPTKARDQLDYGRSGPPTGPDPVVVMDRQDSGVTLLDGHHRFYAAKDAGRETLLAVRLDLSGAVKGSQ